MNQKNPLTTFSEDELYDLVMHEIEPELTTAVLPTLEELYKDETDAEYAVRKERYANAMKEYARRVEHITEEWKKTLHESKKAIVANYQKQSTEQKGSILSDLEDEIDALS